MNDFPWICIRQRAGPLVKECRSIRPRLSSHDTIYERTEKNKILRPPRDSSVCRTRVDRLELRLALFRFEGTRYDLSFDSESLPPLSRAVPDRSAHGFGLRFSSPQRAGSLRQGFRQRSRFRSPCSGAPMTATGGRPSTSTRRPRTA